jgi:hypothetical protein
MPGIAGAKMPGGETPERHWKRTFAAAIAGLVWFGLAVQLYFNVEEALAGDFSLAGHLIQHFSFFTNETNLLIAVTLTITYARPRSEHFLTKPRVNSALAVYIIVVGAVYAALLRNLWQPHGMQLAANYVLHDAIPFLYPLYWLAFLAEGNLRWVDPLWWLLYPVVYFFYIVLGGAAVGAYPYPFIDAARLGLARVFLNGILLLAVFLVLGVTLTAIDHLLSPVGVRGSGLAARPNSDKLSR